MNKKLISKILFIAVLASGMNAFAGTITLDSWSSKTYVSSYHPDNYFADTYVGTVSICGTDRKSNGGGWLYPHESKVTYDVQGDVRTCSVYSNSDTDNTTRTNSITVKDEWDAGPKTQVYGKIVGWESDFGPYKVER